MPPLLYRGKPLSSCASLPPVADFSNIGNLAKNGKASMLQPANAQFPLSI
jgi:hypothetical protein